MMVKTKNMSLWLSLTAVVALIAVSYFNVVDSEFQFDDFSAITNNLNIKNIDNFRDPELILGIVYGQRYITDLSFAVNYYFGRLNPRGYHLFSIYFHLIVCFAVYFLARKIFNRSGPVILNRELFFSFLSAAIFTVHPVNTAAVSYVAQRSEILSAFFYIISFFLFINAIEHKKTAAVALLYAGGVIAFFLSLGSKINAISLPAVVLLYDVIFAEDRSFYKRLIFYSPLIIGIAVVGGMFLFSTRGSEDVGFSIQNLDALTYLLTQFRVIVTYVRLLIFPVDQNIDYEYRLSLSLFEWDTFLSMLFIAGLILIAFFLRKRQKMVSFCIFWFFITLMPSSSFVPVVDVIFEHRVYLPSIGFAFLSAFILIKLLELTENKFSRKVFNIITAVVTSAVLITLTYMTVQRNRVWQSKITLWSDVVSKSPNKPRAYMNLGQALSEKGFYAESIDYLQKGLLCKDDGSVSKQELYRELGVAFYKLGRIDDAIHAYNEGRNHSPFDFTLLNNIAIALLDKGELDQAMQHIDLALRVNPMFADGHNTMGHIYFRKGEYRKAADFFLRAVELNPDVPISHWNVAISLKNLGENKTAYQFFSQFLDMVSDEEQRQQALYQLKILEEKMGR